MGRVVNVVSGSAAPVAGESYRFEDDLSCGPLVPIESVPAWTAARKRSCYIDHDPYGDPDVLRTADKVVLWLATEAADQFMLAWLPAFLEALDVRTVIEVVQFERERDMRDIEDLTLGMLRPDGSPAHPPAVALTAEHLAELDVAWHALTAPEPSALVACARSSSTRFAFLPHALRGFIGNRYPEAASGVNAWEMELLRNVRKVGPRAPNVIGDTLGIRSVDQVADSWLFERMLRLADPAVKEPALAITGDRSAYRFCEVQVTPFGERILDGQANFVDVNGIDDWVGGVHLDSAVGRVWFHRDGELARR